MRTCFLNGSHGVQTGCVGQVEVQQDAIHLPHTQFGAGLGERLVPDEGVGQGCVGEQFLDEERVAAVVLHQQDAVVLLGWCGCHDRGSSALVGLVSARRVKEMRVPGLWWVSTAMVPPWNSTIFLHMARPIPLPG